MWIRSWLALIFTICLPLLCRPAAAVPKTETLKEPVQSKIKTDSKETKVIEQVLESSLQGTYQIRLSEKSIKIEYHSTGFILVAKAPDWLITVVSPASKSYAVCTPKEWRAFCDSTIYSVPELKNYTKVGGKKTIDSATKLPLIETVYRGHERGGAGELWHNEEMDDLIGCRFITYDLKVEEAPLAIIYGCFGLPKGDGLLKAVLKESKDKKLYWTIRSKSLKVLSRQDNAAKEPDYTVPKGYKRESKLSRELVYGKAAPVMDEMLKTFGEASR